MRALPSLESRFPSLHRRIRRHRRLIAAILGGVGVLLALGSLRAPPPIAIAPPDQGISRSLQAGEVAVPVELTSPAFASALRAGDLVDLISTNSDGVTSTLATSARILTVPTNTGLSSSAVLVVAVREEIGTTLASGSAQNSGVAVIIRKGHERGK